MQKILVHTDGGSRGNPGPAAIGVIIEGAEIGKKDYGEYLGERTNNQAEYEAVIFALKKLKQLIGSEKASQTVVEINVDSELLIKQLNGKYKVKEKNIQNLFFEIWNLKLDFNKVIFHHILREQNKKADALVNQILDREDNKLKL